MLASTSWGSSKAPAYRRQNLLYYRGLRRTTASAATVAELAFPVTALVVNAIAFGTVLSGSQLAGAALLAGTVLALGLADRRGDPAVGVWHAAAEPVRA
jgi:drug/metabolite transporter (DMT)-like permease